MNFSDPAMTDDEFSDACAKIAAGGESVIEPKENLRRETARSVAQRRTADAEIMGKLAGDEPAVPGAAPDLRSAVSAQLTKTSTLRSHSKRAPGRPIVILTGDGSPEGTKVELESGEVPGPVVRFSVRMDLAASGMAWGNLVCKTPKGEETVSAWIRFGATRSSEPTG